MSWDDIPSACQTGARLWSHDLKQSSGTVLAEKLPPRWPFRRRVATAGLLQRCWLPRLSSYGTWRLHWSTD